MEIFRWDKSNLFQCLFKKLFLPINVNVSILNKPVNWFSQQILIAFSTMETLRVTGLNAKLNDEFFLLGNSFCLLVCLYVFIFYIFILYFCFIVKSASINFIWTPCGSQNCPLTLWCLVVTKRSHILKQTFSWKLQVCLSMCDIFVTTRR